ncbi:MAG: flagellar basal body L-ring protein FlgH [Pseudomonadota bacterium]
MKTKYIGLTIVSVLAGCATQTPAPEFVAPFSPIDTMATNAATQQAQAPAEQNPSLWNASQTSLLGLNRPVAVGDLLTVVVNMNDQAIMRNRLTRTRDSSEDLSIEALFGLPQWAQTLLPQGSSFSPAIDIDRQSELEGDGQADRQEQIAFRLAAKVVGMEPNGNLIIQGYQQTTVGGETRYLGITGLVRTQDITRGNEVTYDRIANAQISYVSQGPATGNINPKFVPKILDKYLPF